MHKYYRFSLWTGGVVAAILVGFVGVQVFHFNRELLAAIGNLDFSTVQLWQQQGGITSTLELGQNGVQVKLAQIALASDSQVYFFASPNGYFGDGTQAAVRNFQAEYNLPITGVIDKQTAAIINSAFFWQLCPGPQRNTQDLSLAHVTKLQGLPVDYVPTDLVNITGMVKTSGIQCITKDAMQALKWMFDDAAAEGVGLSVSSGYRRPEIQQLTYDFWIQVEGSKATREVALPYHSEHQTGTAVDLAGASQGFTGVRDDFGTTLEGKWLAKNAFKYGYILSYPERVDGEYVHEPWHYRFVGLELATKLHEFNISFNEYLNPGRVGTAVSPIEQILVANPNLF